jgi:putative colanic acid biosynthesis glycosyltransferase
MLSVADVARTFGHTTNTVCPQGRSMRKNMPKEHIFMSNIIEKNIHLVLSKITGFNGCFSYFGTYNLLKWIDKRQPDIIHLHNLHGWYINLPMLFKYIKEHNIRVVWTLHDCWSFTGQCPHFTMIKCDKWKTGCYECPQYREYPEAYVDRTKTMYKLKKKWFTGVQDLTIVTPSEWLAGLVKQSYLKEYPVKVINNGIDLDIFKPAASDFREKYKIENKFVLLGVSFIWNEKKGLDVFIELAKRLDPIFQIVLVGTNETVDAKLPENIISIHRTQDQKELAEIYTAADLFVNPTREENFPTVNIEALACGTPVITYKTGGSPEIIDETCGAIVPCDDVDALVGKILKVYKTKPFSKEACINRAWKYDMKEKFMEYIKLYEGL